jgi:hypothetical protein
MAGDNIVDDSTVLTGTFRKQIIGHTPCLQSCDRWLDSLQMTELPCVSKLTLPQGSHGIKIMHGYAGVSRMLVRSAVHYGTVVSRCQELAHAASEPSNWAAPSRKTSSKQALSFGIPQVTDEQA